MSQFVDNLLGCYLYLKDEQTKTIPVDSYGTSVNAYRKLLISLQISMTR